MKILTKTILTKQISKDKIRVIQNRMVQQGLANLRDLPILKKNSISKKLMKKKSLILILNKNPNKNILTIHKQIINLIKKTPIL